MPDSHDPQRYTRQKYFSPYTNLFIAVVKIAVKQNDSRFLCEGEHLEYWAEICGVSNNAVDAIRINYYMEGNKICK